MTVSDFLVLLPWDHQLGTIQFHSKIIYYIQVCHLLTWNRSGTYIDLMNLKIHISHFFQKLAC